ncbi:hypothetical protein INT43_005245 [Umbelopsis isabellina]|uniref:Uncharacterized protein n=1 Tax=Mortierella isabellina TaxID=91625 RepID=A0A8H7U8V4_MORIS|nr:hypothetical protein INT43_005245 [Umbelopsis isabellina]
MAIPAGTPILLQELVQEPATYHGRSVRATGILMGYNPDENRAIIEHKGHALDVATDLLDTFSYNTKDLLQCIGELEYNHDSNRLLLRARVSRKVDGLDLDLYEKAIMVHRKYEEKYVPST